jgi:hypothetical protein
MVKPLISANELLVLQNKIFALKNYISALYKRLSLVRGGYASKTNYEKNEVDIVICETKYLIAKKNIYLRFLETEFKTKFVEYYNSVEEVLKNYESLLHNVMKFYQDNVEIKHFLYPINWKKLNNNFELKMELYYELKTLVEKQNKVK